MYTTWTPRRRRAARPLTALVAATALGAGTLGAAQAAPRSSDDTIRVTYRGYEFAVPAGWDVIDLDKDPGACVRFDQHAVYLGTPGDRQDCPARAKGRTEALLVQPAEAATAEVTENRTAGTYRAVADQIAVTAAYGQDRERIQEILRGAGLPVASARAESSAEVPAAPAVPDDATSFKGKGFDACTAPSQASMDAWKGTSGYGAIGVYVGGVNRACAQPKLTAKWVQTQYANGWRFFPLYVGRQPSADGGSCLGGCASITDPEPQGKDAADDAVRQAAAVGFGPGSVIYNDLEHYAGGNAVTTRVLTYLESWTTRLHELGYRSGAYGSVSSLITDLVEHADDRTLPDVIHFAHWNDEATTTDSVIPAALWADHQRIHQYAGNRTETHGGVKISIDRNKLDVGSGAGKRSSIERGPSQLMSR
ncbi:glycoside hydrolase domain-containing protein [Streptomyces avermitilis]|uniref:glycoside hydrolase domain-containing protein n=1 Tax=Streptomyces avermitilis TaxID=33903 RepID=UPI0033ACDA23